MTATDPRVGTRPGTSSHTGGVGAALLRQWRTAVAAFLLILAASVVATFLTPQQWAASAVVSFTPRVETGISPDSVALVAHRYAVVVTSDAAADEVSRAMTTPADGELADAISTDLEPGTGNLRITVVLDDRDEAVAAANVAARQLVRTAADDPLVNSSLSSAATARAADRTPPRSLLLAAGTGAAALLGVVAGVLGDQLRVDQSRGLRSLSWRSRRASRSAPGTGRPAC